MYKVVLIISIGLIISGCKNNKHFSNKLESSTQEQNLTAQIESIIKDYEDLKIFSGIVLVANKGVPAFHKAYGLADRDANITNSVNTLFDIGSMNKTFTKIVVKQLVSEGSLNMNDYLTDHLTGFTATDADKITITHLLNHESGFGDYHTPNYFDLPLKERTLQAIVERAKSNKLYFEPGTENEYSNLGYVILGAIIENVSGLSYFENVKNRIIEPLDLKHTYVNNFENLKGNIAKGYYYSPLGDLEESAEIQDLPNPDGGFLSTTMDIMTFYRSYYYDDILLSEVMKRKDPEFEYLKTLPEGAATGASGGFEGFNTSLYQVYKSDQTIIVFANMDEPVAERLGVDILQLLRGKTPAKPKLPAIQNVRKHYQDHGIDYIKNNFEELITNFHPTDPKDIILNQLGYAYLYETDNKNNALELFKLNTELFSESPNCWDSYGEALMAIGNNIEAIKAYKKALQLDPNMKSAKAALIKLKSE